MSADDAGAIVVLTTAGSAEEAGTLAGALVERRVAACVQVVAIAESVYWWEGRVAREAEWLLLCKTTRARYADLERAILELHSYATPEIVALPAERVSASYLAWLGNETKTAQE